MSLQYCLTYGPWIIHFWGVQSIPVEFAGWVSQVVCVLALYKGGKVDLRCGGGRGGLHLTPALPATTPINGSALLSRL